MEDIDEFLSEVFAKHLALVTSANAVPRAEKGDFAFHETFRAFASAGEDSRARVAALVAEIERFVNPTDADADAEADADTDTDGVGHGEDGGDQALFGRIAELSDMLLECADGYMDEASGRGQSAAHNSSADVVKQVIEESRDAAMMKRTQHGLEKPQRAFMSQIDNSRERPFKPRLRVKPHARVPLKLKAIPRVADAAAAAEDGVDLDGPATQYPHPYETELQRLEFADWQLANPAEVVDTDGENEGGGDGDGDADRAGTGAGSGAGSGLCKPPPMNDDDGEDVFVFVDTENAFEDMMDHIREHQELAVDLEHHNVHSFQGITCLMQISTREMDFVVDVLQLWSFVPMLLDVFANPAVVKVFHGADSDIVWLQRDFGIYVVNLFDTYRAAKILQYPARSLAYLLEAHCQVKTNKRYQMSDWRKRPISRQKMRYARMDTHYLLYIYDKMRAELHALSRRRRDASPTAAVLKCLHDSREVCLLRYEKPPFKPLGYRAVLRKWMRGSHTRKQFTAQQQDVLARLWNWRDEVAREEDESPTYVLNNTALAAVSHACPETAAALAQVCPDMSTVLQRRQDGLLAVIADVVRGGPVAVGPMSAAAPSSSFSASAATSSPMAASAAAAAATATAETTATSDARGSVDARAVTAPGVLLSGATRSDTVHVVHVASPPAAAAAGSAYSMYRTSPSPVLGAPLDQEAIYAAMEWGTQPDQQPVAFAASQPHPHRQSATHPAPTPTRSTSPRAPGPTGGMPSLTVPTSLEEIYAISNRNRRKHKQEKKKLRDSWDDPKRPHGRSGRDEASSVFSYSTVSSSSSGSSNTTLSTASLMDIARSGGAPSVASSGGGGRRGGGTHSQGGSAKATEPGAADEPDAAAAATSGPEQYYFAERAKKSRTMTAEETLDFAESVGWTSAQDRAAILSSSNVKQVVHRGDGGGGGGGGGGHGARSRSSFDK